MYLTEIASTIAAFISVITFVRVVKSNKKTEKSVANIKDSIRSEFNELHSVLVSEIKKFGDESLKNQEKIDMAVSEFSDRLTFIEAFIYFSEKTIDNKKEKPIINYSYKDHAENSRSQGAKKMWARRKLKEMASKEE